MRTLPLVALCVAILISGCTTWHEWVDRQTSTVEDWLAEPGEETVEPEPDPIPPPVAEGPCESGQGSQTFLWKPEAENDGKAVVLLPARYRRSQIDSVHIEGGKRDGEEPRNVYCPEGRNGNRVHVRWAKKGGKYGEDFRVVVVTADGREHTWKIDEGDDRDEQR
jgi:hypothetical protein